MRDGLSIARSIVMVRKASGHLWCLIDDIGQIWYILRFNPTRLVEDLYGNGSVWIVRKLRLEEEQKFLDNPRLFNDTEVFDHPAQFMETLDNLIADHFVEVGDSHDPDGTGYMRTFPRRFR